MGGALRANNHIELPERMVLRRLALFFEFVFTRPTDRAVPVIGQIFKSCSGLDPIIRISYFRIVHIATNRTDAFIHFNFLLV